MKKHNTTLIAVGLLTEDLAEFEEEYSDRDVVCWTPDGKPCYINDAELDEDGDLCLSLDEDYSDTYDVAALLEVLGEYDDNTPVYLTARGLYLNIKDKNDSTIFKEDCDRDNDTEIISCCTSILGSYKEDENDVCVIDKDPEKESVWLKIALVMCIILCSYGLYYNVVASINKFSFGNVVATIGCLFLVVISIRSLLSAKKVA